MGEIADMILDGILCQGCGVYIGEGDGWPSFCGGCRPSSKAKAQPIKATKRCGCGNCGRVFASVDARDQHYAQKRRIGDPRHQGEPKHRSQS